MDLSPCLRCEKKKNAKSTKFLCLGDVDACLGIKLLAQTCLLCYV